MNKGWKQTKKYDVNSFIGSDLYFGKPLCILKPASFLFRETVILIIAVFIQNKVRFNDTCNTCSQIALPIYVFLTVLVQRVAPI